MVKIDGYPVGVKPAHARGRYASRTSPQSLNFAGGNIFGSAGRSTGRKAERFRRFARRLGHIGTPSGTRLQPGFRGGVRALQVSRSGALHHHDESTRASVAAVRKACMAASPVALPSMARWQMISASRCASLPGCRQWPSSSSRACLALEMYRISPVMHSAIGTGLENHPSFIAGAPSLLRERILPHVRANTRPHHRDVKSARKR